MRRLTDGLEQVPPLAALAASAGIVAAVALLEHFTGRLSLTDLYLLACFLAAWRAGTLGGILITALVGVAMGLTEWLRGPATDFRVWNRAIELSLMAVVSLLVAALRRSHLALRELAQHDPLTGLDNRQAFADRAALELAVSRRDGSPITIAYFDLDDFKAVNDTRGHAEGDRALRAVAQVLRRRVRASDACARLGGDEFGVLLRGAEPADARKALEQLREALRAEAARGGWDIGFSTGAVTFRKFPGTLDDALRLADGLMYVAKRAEKGSLRHEIREPTD